MLKPNNLYWIATENYGILKATYKEAGPKNIGYFLCMLTDGYLVLNNGINYYKDRIQDEIDKPVIPEDKTNRDQWLALGWNR